MFKLLGQWMTISASSPHPIARDSQETPVTDVTKVGPAFEEKDKGGNDDATTSKGRPSMSTTSLPYRLLQEFVFFKWPLLLLGGTILGLLLLLKLLPAENAESLRQFVSFMGV